MPNLKSFAACNPSFLICLQTEDDYHVDLASGRGDSVGKKMRRAIALSSNKPTYQLLSGHVGSGKTIELLRLKSNLEQQGFAVIYVMADQYLQINDIGLAELWLVILNLMVQQIEKGEDSLSLAYLPNAISEIEQWLRMSRSVDQSTYGSRLHIILQALKNHVQCRRQLRYYLEPRLKNSLLVAGEEVTAIAVDRVKQLGKKGLVVMVDNLDRLSFEQMVRIFGDGEKYLRQFQCHIIFTLPLMSTSEQLQQFVPRLSQISQPILLPNLTLRDRLGAVNLECLSLLRQVVLARMLPNVASEIRLDQVTKVFDNLETLDLLALSSHGHLPYLLSLLCGCLQWQDPPIQIETLNQVLQMDQETRLSTISDRDWQILQTCLASPHALTLEAIDLCRRGLLFEHHDLQGYWFSSPFRSLDTSPAATPI